MENEKEPFEPKEVAEKLAAVTSLDEMNALVKELDLLSEEWYQITDAQSQKIGCTNLVRLYIAHEDAFRPPEIGLPEKVASAVRIIVHERRGTPDDIEMKVRSYYDAIQQFK